MEWNTFPLGCIDSCHLTLCAFPCIGKDTQAEKREEKTENERVVQKTSIIVNDFVPFECIEKKGPKSSFPISLCFFTRIFCMDCPRGCFICNLLRE